MVVLAHHLSGGDPASGSARFTDFLTRQLCDLHISILQELQAEFGSQKYGEPPAGLDVGAKVAKQETRGAEPLDKDHLVEGPWSALLDLFEGERTEEVTIEPPPALPISSWSEGEEGGGGEDGEAVSEAPVAEPLLPMTLSEDKDQGDKELAGEPEAPPVNCSRMSYSAPVYGCGYQMEEDVEATSNADSDEVGPGGEASRTATDAAPRKKKMTSMRKLGSQALFKGWSGTRNSERQMTEGDSYQTGDWLRRVSNAVLQRQTVAFAGSLPNASMGAVRGIIATATNGKAVRTVKTQDVRPTWVRMQRPVVEWFIPFVVVANTITLAVQLDFHRESHIWIIIDGAFAGIFFLEMCGKICLHGLLPFGLGTELRCRVWTDSNLRWHLLETLLVTTAIWEVWEAARAHFAGGDVGDIDARKLSLLRVLRLSRFPRLLRICRLNFFSDLMMMISGAMGGMRTLAWSIILLAFPVHVFAMLFREMLGGLEEEPEFASLALAWATMFRCLVSEECSNESGEPIMYLVALRNGWVYGAVYSLAKMCMVFGLFNVITAIYVENTVAAAKYNSLHQKRERLADAQRFADKTKELVEFIWHMYEDQQYTSGSFSESPTRSLGGLGSHAIGQVLHTVTITPAFFNHLRTFKEFQDLLRDLDVADEDQIDLFDTLDVDGSGSVDLEELVVGICKLRGDARRSDVIGVLLTARNMQMELSRIEKQVDRMVVNQSRVMHTMGLMLDDSIAASTHNHSTGKPSSQSWVPSNLSQAHRSSSDTHIRQRVSDALRGSARG